MLTSKTEQNLQVVMHVDIKTSAVLIVEPDEAAWQFSPVLVCPAEGGCHSVKMDDWWFIPHPPVGHHV